MRDFFSTVLLEIEKETGIKNMRQLCDILNTKRIVFKKENGFDYNEASSSIISFYISSCNISDAIPKKYKYSKIKITITHMANTLSEEEVAKSIVSKLLFSSN
ncbi:MAG TPA: hypothetical protein PLH65_00425 [bacterium]|nr:hypothetical protein [bacterium]HPN67804.1 hypothetical protein [bacterium]